MGELKRIIGELNKKNPGSVMKLGEKAYQRVPRVSTGSFALDIEIGGGWEESSIVEITGEFSTGKSYLALKAIAEVQKLGRPAAYINLETLDTQWAKKLGVDVDNLYIAQPNSAEEAIDVLTSLISSRELGIIVCDSIASLVPQIEIESDASEQQRGVAAKLCNKMSRKIQAALRPINLGDEKSYNRCIVIFTNQIRMNPGETFGNPEVTPHDRGVRFASSIIMRLRSGPADIIKEGDIPVGQTIKFQNKKNKNYTPFRVGQFDFNYKTGEINNIKSIIQYAIAYEIISKSGPFYTFNKEKFKGQAKLIDYLQKKSKEIEKLKKAILAKSLEQGG